MALVALTLWGSGASRRRQSLPDDLHGSQSCPGDSEQHRRMGSERGRGHSTSIGRAAMSAIAPDARSTRQMLRLSASTGSVSRPAEGAEERHPRRAPSLMMLRLSSLFEVREDGDEEAPSSVRGVESSGRL